MKPSLQNVLVLVLLIKACSELVSLATAFLQAFHELVSTAMVCFLLLTQMFVVIMGAAPPPNSQTIFRCYQRALAPAIRKQEPAVVGSYSPAWPSKDPDGLDDIDVDDASVDGVLASQNQPPANPCESEGACETQFAHPPEFSIPGISTFVGPGNVNEPSKCPKGRIRRGGKCEKRAGFGKSPVTASSLAVNATHIYWANAADEKPGTGSIARANLELKEVEPEWIKKAGKPKGLGVNATHIYWSANGEVVPNPGNDLYRYEAKTGELTDLVPDNIAENGIEVKGVLDTSADASHLYFATKGGLGSDAANWVATDTNGAEANRDLIGVGR